jgi:hypothetical protein
MYTYGATGAANIARCWAGRSRISSRGHCRQGHHSVQPRYLFHGADMMIASTTLRIFVPLMTAIAVGAHLLWEHWHGGIASHHLLNRADLPAISNLWGIIAMPGLAWLAVIVAQLAKRSARQVGLGFGVAFLVGAAIAVLFHLGINAPLLPILIGALVAGLVLPGYRLECLLGFALAMMVTFGGVLPLIVGGIIAAISAFAHLVVRRYLFRRS